MTRTTTAAVVHAPGEEFALKTVELDDLRAGEVYLRIEAAGVCHTDMNMQVVVPMPAVVGHEGVGVVEAVGPGVTYVKPGDRAVISWPACMTCPMCESGRRDLCDNQFQLLFSGRRLDGSPTMKLDGEWISGAFFQQSSFANHSIAPADSLVKIEDDIAPEILASLPCGVMTGAGAVINALRVGVKDDVAVFGAGGVGLSAVIAARLVGAYPIVAVDINDDRLALAKELGASDVFNAREGDVAARIKEIAPRGLKFAIDTSGVEASWQAAAESIGMGGTFANLSTPKPGPVDFKAIELLSKGATFQFILGGASIPRIFIPQMIEWYKQGRFPVDRIVKTFDFADINLAFAESVAGSAVKPVLLMS